MKPSLVFVIALAASITALAVSIAVTISSHNTRAEIEETERYTRASAQPRPAYLHWEDYSPTRRDHSISGVYVTKTANGWTAQYKMLPCPDGNNRYTSIPDRDEADTFTLFCEKPQLKIRIGGTDQHPKFRTETATEAAERVRQE